MFRYFCYESRKNIKITNEQARHQEPYDFCFEWMKHRPLFKLTKMLHQSFLPVSSLELRNQKNHIIKKVLSGFFSFLVHFCFT